MMGTACCRTTQRRTCEWVQAAHRRPRSPDATQRVALRGAVRCRAGAVTNAGVWYGPGSAERHEECRTASGTRHPIFAWRGIKNRHCAAMAHESETKAK